MPLNISARLNPLTSIRGVPKSVLDSLATVSALEDQMRVGLPRGPGEISIAIKSMVRLIDAEIETVVEEILDQTETPLGKAERMNLSDAMATLCVYLSKRQKLLGLPAVIRQA